MRTETNARPGCAATSAAVRPLTLPRRADALFVQGGSSYYLLQRAREAGFLELLGEFVETGKLYIGMSAGAVIVGPDIEPMSIVTDTSLGGNLTTTQAAGIVDFVVLPHFDQREAAYREAIARYGGRYTLVPLRDDEAVLVEGTAWRVAPCPS